MLKFAPFQFPHLIYLVFILIVVGDFLYIIDKPEKHFVNNVLTLNKRPKSVTEGGLNPTPD